MNFKFPFMKAREPKSPRDPKAEVERIVAKADANATVRAAKRAADAQRRVEREKERIERGKRPFSVTPLVLGLIKGTAWVVTLAAFAFIGVGLLFDMVFYTQQSTDPLIMGGLCVFAVALRFTADFVPVVLQWSKPEREPGERRRVMELLQFWKKPAADPNKPSAPTTGVMAVLEKNHLARGTLRFLCVLAIVGSAVATLSFFSSGHETRTYRADTVAALEQTQVRSKAERKADLEKQRTEAKTTRDNSVSASKEAMQVIKDQVVGTSSADNATLQQITDKIDGYNKAYETKSSEIDKQINAINSEVETVEVGAATDRIDHAPFLSVYRFLARFASSEERWTVVGAVFFSVLFELLCAFMLGALFVLLKGIGSFARLMQAREQQQVLEWGNRLSKIESDARIESLKAESLRAAEEAHLNLELALQRAQQAEQRATVDRQVADIERRIQKANAEAEAARRGEVFVSDDEEREAEAALKTAQAQERIAKLKAEAEAARARAVEAAKPPPAPPPAPPPPPANDEKPPLTPQQQAALNASIAAAHAREAEKVQHKYPVGDWSRRPDRLSEAV